MTEKIVHQFDAYCKRVLQNEKIDYYREKQYRMKHEVFKLRSADHITFQHMVYNSFIYTVIFS